MSTSAGKLLTEDEYLTLELASELKHEFCDGVMIAMSRAGVRLNLIVANLLQALGNKLDGTPSTCKSK